MEFGVEVDGRGDFAVDGIAVGLRFGIDGPAALSLGRLILEVCTNTSGGWSEGKNANPRPLPRGVLVFDRGDLTNTGVGLCRIGEVIHSTKSDLPVSDG